MMRDTISYTMPLTLERHFEELSQSAPAVMELYSLWKLLKKRIEEKLANATSTFVSYSLHDKSHCFSVVQSVERLLGQTRICQLSATDTFMLLACIYAHDYGMAQNFNKICDILESTNFETFLEEKEKNGQHMEKEEKWAVHNLFQYLWEKKTTSSLSTLYFSIMLVIQLYLRPMHWRDVSDIQWDFEKLFEGHLKKRFIYGSEGIVEICMCHGQTTENLFQLSYCADGMAGDIYHPRFIAAMLRLGDLLDLDNGRFPMWFVGEIAKNRNIISRLSMLHFGKHEAVSHLLITPQRIEITANCYATMFSEKNANGELEKESAMKDCYDVAALIYDWTEQLREECREITLHWNDIVQKDFGYPPTVVDVKIYVDGKVYVAEYRPLQMQMSQERVMKLLEGTNIYNDRYVGIREMIQNAVDATLLQFWNDLLQNRYSSQKLLRQDVIAGFDLWELLDRTKAVVFKNYDIVVEVIEDKQREQVIVVVKDKGIGITMEDVRYIADIGSSREKNMRVRRLTEKMPEWLKPSGVFGIGLQSVFQLTDCIEFYTRQHNQPERQISLYSYGKNQGKIDTRIVSESGSEMYYDNAVPGTNAKIVIEPQKFFHNDGKSNAKKFLYYDPEFDSGEMLHMIFEEVFQVCKSKIEEVEYDYFNINFEGITIEQDGTKTVPREFIELKNARNTDGDKVCLRNSYFYPRDRQKGTFGDHLQSFGSILPEEPYVFQGDKAYFWDKNTFRCYRLTLRPCTIKRKGDKCYLSLPEKMHSLYEISYKFNKISNIEAIYAQQGFPGHMHTGFLKLEVLILDDSPMSYMNIDRDRLREGAIDEEELIAVRQEIVRRWCSFLCEKAGTEHREERKGGRSGNKGMQIKKYFSDNPGLFLSLILTFYCNVSTEAFKHFMELCGEMDSVWNIKLENEEVEVHELWEEGKQFRVAADYRDNYEYVNNKGFGCSQKDVRIPRQVEDKRKASVCRRDCCEMKADSICRLPHRLISIESIQQGVEGGQLWYDLSLQAFDSKVKAVQMDEAARVYDYIYALDLNLRNEEYKKCRTLIRKVFKPDSMYRDLIVPCFPHTFRKGQNLALELDYCIRSYILSPFDQTSCEKLEQALRGKKNSSQITADQFTDITMQESQMERCIAFILAKRFSECEDQDEIRRRIQQQYRKFAGIFFEKMMEYREEIIQFWKEAENDNQVIRFRVN